MDSISNSLLAMTAMFNAGLAIFVLRGKNWRNPSNLYFGIFLGSLVLWSLVLIGFQKSESHYLTLYLAKATYAIALIIGGSFFNFSSVFPCPSPVSKKNKWIVLTVMTAYIVALLQPTFLTKSISHDAVGKMVMLGLQEYTIFFFLFCMSFGFGIVRMWRNYLHSQGMEKRQLLVIASSVSIAGLAGVYYNLILPSPVFENFHYIWSGPIFTSGIAVAIMYSIFRLHLFNVKVIATELLVSFLFIFTLLRTLIATTLRERVLDGGLFALVFVIGMLLIKAVYVEVRSRERIDEQEKNLEKINEELKLANRQQETLLHFISHEVKGYLAKSQMAFSSIVGNDYGPVTPALNSLAARMLDDMRTGIDTVSEILNAGSLKKGVVNYSMEPFDVRSEVDAVVADFKKIADEKKITLLLEAPDATYRIVGDRVQLRKHVMYNLLDNALKYSRDGGCVTVSLSRRANHVVFSIRDTGVGLSADDKSRLFTEGGRGKNSMMINPHSTGYGLYIARSIVAAHQGTIWAESDGEGKGSTFFFEVPAAA